MSGIPQVISNVSNHRYIVDKQRLDSNVDVKDDSPNTASIPVDRS